MSETNRSQHQANEEHLPDIVKYTAHFTPPIESGQYTAQFTQYVEESGQKEPYKLFSSQPFHVQGPQFSIDPGVDIHSIFPAPGHSDYTNSLAHVVFNDHLMPWERDMGEVEEKTNRLPWLAVISFTEEELQVPKGDVDRLFQDKKVDQAQNYSFATTANDLAGVVSISSPLNSAKPVEYDKTKVNPINTVLLRKDLCRSLFSNQETPNSQTPDLSRYAYLAHVQTVQGQITDIAEAGSLEQSHSIIISHRPGPTKIAQPTTVVTHVVSLEGVASLDISENNKNDYYGLVSLHSWSWMAMSMQSDIFSTMRTLGQNIHPLRLKDEFLKSLLDPTKSPADDSEGQWLHRRLTNGFSIKDQTDLSGDTSDALFRGPLSATYPFRKASIQPWTAYSKELQVVDSETGMVDAYYQTAWELGRLLAIGDYNFLASLLRFRGTLHSRASLRTREGLAQGFLKMNGYLDVLPSALDDIAAAHMPSNVGDANAVLRWFSGWDKGKKLPRQNEWTAGVANSFRFQDNVESIANEIAAATRYRKNDTEANNEAVDHANSTENTAYDLEKIMVWLSDILRTERLPMNYFVPDTQSLPRESIRTFFVDPLWLECAVDGALSHANHLQSDDDVIKRQIKVLLNEYLHEPQSSTAEQNIRLPRWGFLLRSIVVSSQSALKIEMPTTKVGDKIQSGILVIRRLSEDVLMCLLDQIPGQDAQFMLTIGQPSHQQGFALGDHLDETQMSFQLQNLPQVTGVQPTGLKTTSKTWNSEDADAIFDWDTRTLKVKACANFCFSALNQDGLFSWPKEKDIPSSVMATQLIKAAQKVQLRADPDVDLQKKLAAPATNPWLSKEGAGQVFIPPQPDPSESTPDLGFQPEDPTPSLPHVALPGRKAPVTETEISHVAETRPPTANTSTPSGTENAPNAAPEPYKGIGHAIATAIFETIFEIIGDLIKALIQEAISFFVKMILTFLLVAALYPFYLINRIIVNMVMLPLNFARRIRTWVSIPVLRIWRGILPRLVWPFPAYENSGIHDSCGIAGKFDVNVACFPLGEIPQPTSPNSGRNTFHNHDGKPVDLVFKFQTEKTTFNSPN